MSTKEKPAPPPSVGEETDSVLKGPSEKSVCDAQKPVYGDEQANRKALETPEPHIRPDIKKHQEEVTAQEKKEQDERDAADKRAKELKAASEKKPATPNN